VLRESFAREHALFVSAKEKKDANLEIRHYRNYKKWRGFMDAAN
jgi:hypothetical protein